MGRVYGDEEDSGAARAPRLFIREMVMENFKSYAGKQIVGPFHKCFSAVVGPNGSGKSNVIDAMLFVFGKRAKQMRLNKVSELIHNSTHHQNLDRAQVSVHFQEIIDLEGDSYDPVPGSDFALTRVAFRDNSSKYYLDDRLSSFAEVTKKLKAKGVDLDNNRFLILQGEVEQISLMKPKAQGPHDDGFLEYLEDIIGSNQYVEKIEQAERRLETINEKRTSAIQRVKHAEKQKDGLEGAKNEAVSYMLKQAEFLKWQKKSGELGFEAATADATNLKNQMQESETKLKEEKQKLADVSKDLQELERNYTKHAKRREELEGQLKSCADEFKEFERQDLKYQEDLKHLNQKLKKLNDKLAKDAARIEDIEREVEESKVLIPKLEEEVSTISKQLVVEEEKLEHLKELSKDEVEEYRASLTIVRAELEPWDKQLIDSQGKIDLAASESKLLKEKHETGRRAYDAAEKQIETIKAALQEKESNLPSQEKSLKEHRLLAKSSREEEQACLKEEESLAAEEQAAKAKLNEMVSLVETEKSQGSVLKAVLHAKESGQIEGIYGRLGDLGAIDAKYDVAVSTSCGGLDYIIVETAASAQACVEMLRKNNLGVATFMILEKQQHLSQKMVQVNTPEGVPRLFDLIAVRDQRIKPAFYAALGNTVVAANLDQATRIAYGQDRDFRRVVTLEGALFEKSGTMSGGGGKPRGGRMGTAIRDSSVSKEAIKNAEAELAKLAEQLVALGEKRTRAVQQYQSSEMTAAKLETEIAKLRMEIDGLKAQQQDITRQLKSLKAKAVPKESELQKIQSLDEMVLQLEKEHHNLQENSKGLREKADVLQKNIENAGGEKLKRQKTLVNKLQTDVDSKSTEINRRNVQMTRGCETVIKLRKAIVDGTQDKSTLGEAKDKKAFEFKEIEKKAFVVQEKYKEIQEIMEKQREELESTKAVYNDKKKVVEELRTGEVETQFRLDDLRKHAKEADAKLKTLQKNILENDRALREHVDQIQKEGIEPELLKPILEESSCSLQTALENVDALSEELKEMQPNLDCIAEYRLKASLYADRVNELNEVTHERDEVKKLHDELRKRRLDEFLTGFNTISIRLKEMYQMITLGGDAELELVDSLDPFSEGVEFSVRPPKKSWKKIGNLSGGEKTLSSLSLVFALHHYKPTPLYVMDEIDAALDFKNVSIVGHYIKESTRDAQFVIISLRNNMFELADRLIGIYKTDNCTKSVTINPHSFAVRHDDEAEEIIQEA